MLTYIWGSAGGAPLHITRCAPPPQPVPQLTERQLECLVWISEGKSSNDIGQILGITGRTVDYHASEICERLDVRTRMQAVAFAMQKGWL